MRTLSVVTLAFLPALAWTAPAPPDKAETAGSPAEQVRLALDKPLTLKIDKQPLNTAIELLHEKTGIRFVVDATTIQQQLGFTPDQPPTPVDVEVKDKKARVALRAVLGTYGLGYVVLGDTVLVTTEDVAAQRQMRQPVSLDVDGADLTAALKRLGREAGVNLVLDSRAAKEAKTSVTLQLDEVPLDTAVRLLAEMAGLKAVRVGNVLFVTKKEFAAEMRADPDLAPPAQTGQAAVYANTAVLGGLGGAPGLIAPNAAPNPPAVAPPVPPTVPPTVGPASEPSTADPTPPASR